MEEAQVRERAFRDTFGCVTLIQGWHLRLGPPGTALSWVPVKSEDLPYTEAKGRGQDSPSI